MPLLNLNRTHAPSEGDGRTIHDNIYKYTDSAGVDRTRRGSLRLAPKIVNCGGAYRDCIKRHGDKT